MQDIPAKTDGGSNDCNKGKQANTRAGMKSAKTAFRLRLEYKPERRKWEREVPSHLFFFSPHSFLYFFFLSQIGLLTANTHTHRHAHTFVLLPILRLPLILVNAFMLNPDIFPKPNQYYYFPN